MGSRPMAVTAATSITTARTGTATGTLQGADSMKRSVRRISSSDEAARSALVLVNALGRAALRAAGCSTSLCGVLVFGGYDEGTCSRARVR